jgi:hypothetical protein
MFGSGPYDAANNRSIIKAEIPKDPGPEEWVSVFYSPSSSS